MLTPQRLPYSWQSAYNPIPVILSSNLHPDGPAVPKLAISAAANVNGYAQFSTASAHGLLAGHSIYVDAHEYKGICRIRSVPGPNLLLTDLPYRGAAVNGGMLWRYYRNYSALLDLYVESVPGNGQFSKMLTLSARPHPDGLYRFDLGPYLRTLLTGPDPMNTDPLRRGAESYRAYFFTWAEQYEEVATDGTVLLLRQPDQWELLDGCEPAQMFDNPLFDPEGLLDGWVQSGTGADWTQSSAAQVNLYSASPKVSKAIGQAVSLEQGKAYRLRAKLDLPADCARRFALQIILTDSDGNTRVLTEVPAGEGMLDLALLIPEHTLPWVSLSVRLVQLDGSGDCEGVVMLNRLELYPQHTCLRIWYAHNSTEQYEEQPGVTEKLSAYCLTNTQSRFLTMRPRRGPLWIRPEERQWLSWIMPQEDRMLAHVRLALYLEGVQTAIYQIPLPELDSARWDMLCDPASLSAALIASGGTALPDSGYDEYRIWIERALDIAGAAGPTERVSEVFAFRTDTYCPSPYRRRLVWLNAKGALEAFVFDAKAGHGLELNVHSRQRRTPGMDDFAPAWRPLAERGRRLQPFLMLESAYAPQEEIQWLWEELLRSPEVYLEQTSETGTPIYLPVSIEPGSFDTYTDGDRLFSVRLKVRYAFERVVQEG